MTKTLEVVRADQPDVIFTVKYTGSGATARVLGVGSTHTLPLHDVQALIEDLVQGNHLA
jgi:hypothetical protein